MRWVTCTIQLGKVLRVFDETSSWLNVVAPQKKSLDCHIFIILYKGRENDFLYAHLPSANVKEHLVFVIDAPTKYAGVFVPEQVFIVQANISD